MDVQDRIQALLRGHSLPFSAIDHRHAQTSEQVAAARGTPLHIGGKSLILRVGGQTPPDFRLFVVSGARRTRSRDIRRFLGIKRMRFATAEELLALTGLTPGCVPPFGRPIFDIPLYVDQSIADNDEIAFSAGQHTRSIQMKTVDYLRAAQPAAIFSFSLPPDR